MKRNLLLISALSAGWITSSGLAQNAAPKPPSTPAPAAPAQIAPQAIPAKIALIAFEQAVFATNEGQKTVQDIQKKYEPKKAQIDSLAAEIDTLKKQLESLPATASADDRAARQRTIDSKDKELQRNAEDAQATYNADLQDAYGKVAQKFSVTLKNYVAENGYTILIDVSNQQSAVMWALPNTDVTEAVVEKYNATSGVAAPPPSAPSASRPAPSAPSAARPAPTKPATSTPAPATKPAPKQ
jgi:Skp family chaperone for outer membrane proteins